MIVCYQSPNGWHAATSEGLIAYGLPSEAALKAAISRVIDGNFEIDVVDAQTWRATYLSALAADTLSTQDQLGAMEHSAEASKLHSRLDMLLASVDELTTELRAERERHEQTHAARQRIEHEQEQQRQAQVASEQERQRKSAEIAEAERWRDLIVKREDDGTVIVYRAIVLEGQRTGKPIKANQIVARYPPGKLPAEVSKRVK